MTGTVQETSVALSSAQRQLWAGQALAPALPCYNMAIACEIEGAVDVACFQRAFARLVQETDSLRARLLLREGHPTLAFPEQGNAELAVVDLSAEPDPAGACEAWVAARIGCRFDLGVASHDSALLALGPARFVWYFNQHHLLVDAGSMAVLLQRLSGYYLADGDAPGPDAVAPPSFEAVLMAQATPEAEARRETARRHWQASATTSPNTRFYAPRPTSLSGRTRRTTLAGGTRRMQALTALCEQAPFRSLSREMSRFRVVATVLTALLHRLGGEERQALGVPVHHRSARTLKGVAGMLIELFPLDVSVAPDDTFLDLHAKIAAQTQVLLRHAVAGSSSAASSRSFDVVLNMITTTFGDFAGHPVKVTWLHPEAGDPAHVLRLQVHDFDGDGALHLLLDASHDALTAQEQDWLGEDLLTVLDAMLADPARGIAEVDVLGQARRSALLAATRAPPAPAVAGVVERFLLQADATPQAPALVTATGSVSYAGLEARARAVAAALAARGLRRGEPVAIALRRSPQAVIAILGTLIAGSPYVPLDRDHPPARLRGLIADAGAVLVIGDAGDGEADPPQVSVAALEAEGSGLDARIQPPAPGDVAYLIYTSGSTGTPKGVVIEHASLAVYLDWAAREYTGGQPRRFALFTSLAFDLTVTSLFVPLVTGGSLVIYDGLDRSRDLLVRDVIEQGRAEVVKLTPAHLALVQDLELGAGDLRVLVVGGEDFKTSLARAVHRRGGGRIAIYNEYGPTEATVACSAHRFDPDADRTPSVPIGRPIDGAELLLLDDSGRLAPRGVVAEIGIAGAGLARGYHERPSLTAGRFVPHPLQHERRVYLSGDRAYWDREHVLHYLGRRDRQLKVRGVRLEVEEIEAALSEHPGVRACAVDVVDGERSGASTDRFCVRCGLDARHPSARLDAQAVCAVCRGYEDESTVARTYFDRADPLEAVVDRVRGNATGTHDAVMLLSGGKDSTYALCQLVELGLRPLVFTLDNGFISDGAKSNIRRVVEKLGLELVIESPSCMNAIFADSLARYSDVCNGCFKTIYTLATNLAHARGIRTIFTGLSRGQIFETRLAGLSHLTLRDPSEIDRLVLQGRKAYHAMEDAVARHLDVSVVRDARALESIEYIDFYRYSDATLATILDYLSREAPWIRPADTGRSTNCLINDVGIHVHTTERGYHNYARPYSWDVRLGHKRRDEARLELEDRIDAQRVEAILSQIDYTVEPAPAPEANAARLTAWYVGDAELDGRALTGWLEARLPRELVPAAFVPLPELPLTANHKVDRARLPRPDDTRPNLASALVAPRTALERTLVEIWEQTLGVSPVGVEDDFFELGGDSILSIQIVSRAQDAGIAVDPQQVFTHPTIAALALAADAAAPEAPEKGPVTGEVGLTPSQRDYLGSAVSGAIPVFDLVHLELAGAPSASDLRAALTAVAAHHDALRGHLARDAQGRWRQVLRAPAEATPPLMLGEAGEGADDASLAVALGEAGTGFGAAHRPRTATGPATLVLAADAALLDDASWSILVEDLALALGQVLAGRPVELPARTHSLRQWLGAMERVAGSEALASESDYWSAQCRDASGDAGSARTLGRRHEVEVRLNDSETRGILDALSVHHRATVAELLVAAVAPLLREEDGQGRLRVALRGEGRQSLLPGVGVGRTLGRLGCPSPVTLLMDADWSVTRALREVKEQLRAVPRAGAGFGILREACPDPTLRAALADYIQPRAAFAYRTHPDPGEIAALRLARPPRGTRHGVVQGRHALEVEASVFRGELRVHLDADRGHLAGAALADLGIRIRARLLAASEVGRAGAAALSATDFPEAAIEQDELDDILAEFDDE